MAVRLFIFIINKLLGTMSECVRMLRERVGTMLELLGTMWKCLGRLETPGDDIWIDKEIICNDWERCGNVWVVGTMCGRYTGA